MPLSFVGGTDGAAADGGPVTLDLTALTGGSDSSPQTGDVVYVVLGALDSDGIEDLTLATSGYTVVGGASDPDWHTRVFRKIMGSTPDTDVVSYTASSSVALSMACHVWRGADQTTPEDAAATTASAPSGSQPDCPSITTVTDGAVVLACAGAISSDAVHTPPSGYDNHFDNGASDSFDSSVSISSKVVSSAGAENPGAYADWHTRWAAITVAIRPAINLGRMFAVFP